MKNLKVNFTSYGIAQGPGKESEDAFGVKSWDETVIAVLADGTGGALGGREASHRIVNTLMRNYQVRPLSWSPDKAITEFTGLLNRTLHQESIARFDSPEMISTLSLAVIEGNQLIGLNVGDSRIYLARGGALQQLSIDHVANEPECRHVLQRAMGLAPELVPHRFQLQIRDGDIIFLCSDGITTVLADHVLAGRLGHGAAARSIVQHARELASPETLDDMSAIVIEVVETGKLQAAAQVPLIIPDSLHKGLLIDGYELIRPFQHSDRVWLAHKDGIRWTLKFAPMDARDNDAVLTQFVKETWNATRVDAPFFVKAFVPENPSARYYVMEFIEAPSLKTVLRARRLDVDEALTLGKFLAEASTHLLRLDLVHGDIKPENMLVVSEYDRLQFRLVDLGSATEIFSITSRAGTASYLAPERFHGSPVCERTEIFAIGVTLFQALTGTLPFGEIERFQTPQFVVPKPPSRLNPNIPPWLDSVILRAISIEAGRRYQHYSELSFDLANPAKVEPFFQPGLSLIERDPLTFYRAGFWIILAIALYLFYRLAIQA